MIQTKVKNVLTSVVTWITVASVALAQVAEQITGLEPLVAEIVASVLAIWQIIRRVSPAPSGTHGLS